MNFVDFLQRRQKSMLIFGLRSSFMVLICHFMVFETALLDQNELEDHGRIKRFGAGGPSFSIEEVYGFPDQKFFIENYVLSSKPLKMTGAAKMSPAFTLWKHDDYFLSLSIPDDEEVNIEVKKKENRNENVISMNFHDFIKIYNSTDYYMVSPLPSFLGPDVLVPCSLQCSDILENHFIAAMMWFSSGGTKSVVHTDAVDNINCLFRGEKEFVMVDPKYQEKVNMDHPEGSYCGVDVDSVDYSKYPGLAEVEYYHVNISAGDCLFIPYKWIHQVRSYNSNVAVNLWWHHYSSKHINLDACDSVCDNSITVDQIQFHGFHTITNSIDIIRDHFQTILLMFKTMDIQTLFDSIKVEFPDDQAPLKDKFDDIVKKLFETLDLNSDGTFTMEELKEMPETGNDKSWEKVQTFMTEIEQFEDDMFEEETKDEKTPDKLEETNDLKDEL